MREPAKLTSEGYERLTAQRDELLKKRKDSLERIKSARQYCDFREDVTYMELLREHARIDEKQMKLEQILADATIINQPNQLELIEVGSQVKIRELPDGPIEAYKLVGEAEAAVEVGALSVASPLGEILVGLRVGEVASVYIAGESLEFEIVAIEK